MEGILLTKIAYGNISLDEITNADIDEFNKVILTVAYYEKNNKKNGIAYIKNLKKTEEDPKRIKVLNKLLERLVITRPMIFDTTAYSTFTGKDINLNLKQKLTKEQEEPRKVITKKVVPLQVKRESNKNLDKILDNIEKSIRNNVSKPIKVEQRKENKPIVVVPVKKEVKPEVINYNILIKDLFSREVTEISKSIYVQMIKPSRYKDAAKAWDNFEVLVEKPIGDKEALRRFVSIISKFDNIDTFNKVMNLIIKLKDEELFKLVAITANQKENKEFLKIMIDLADKSKNENFLKVLIPIVDTRIERAIDKKDEEDIMLILVNAALELKNKKVLKKLYLMLQKHNYKLNKKLEKTL